MQRMKGQGTPVPNGPKEQNYSSFQNYTNPMTSSMAAAAASDPYMSPFYMTSTPYQAFGVGDGTWSNGGEHMPTFLGGYGGQVGYESHSTIDGIFSGGNFGGFNAPAPSFNYGFHGNGDFSAWGGSDVRGGTKTYDEYYQRNVYQDDRVKTLDQGVQGLTLAADPKTIHDLPKDANGCPVATNGAGGEKIGRDSSSPSTGDAAAVSQPKKGLSWASVASQPAKPQPSRRREKASVSSIVPGRHMDIGTWEGKNGGPKPVAPPPAPRPAWEAPRGGSRSTTSTTYSTPPPRTPPQTTPAQQPPSPQVQNQAQQMVPQIQHSPQQQQMPQQQQSAQQLPPQGSPQQQQLTVNQQHHSPNSLLQGPHMRDVSVSPQTSNAYGPPSLMAPQQVLPDNQAPVDDSQFQHDYNPKEFDMSPKNARFFVIKSYSEDDIHRSIKYEIWCSTEHGNKRLDAAFREREGKGPIYLFFSVNGSGHFCGIAQMISRVDYNCSASVWAQDKWKGQFRVKWVYVKDVPNNPLRHIRLENNENKPVTNSRDTQEVPYEKGKQVLKIIHNYRHTTSIFDDFTHYEKRQEETEFRRGHQPSFKDMERDEGRGDLSKDPRGDNRGGDPRGGDPRGGDNRGGDYRGGDPRGGDPRGGDPRGGGDYRDHRDHRDHHRDFHRDYHRGGPGGAGRGRGGHHPHHYHHHRGGGRQ